MKFSLDESDRAKQMATMADQKKERAPPTKTKTSPGENTNKQVISEKCNAMQNILATWD